MEGFEPDDTCSAPAAVVIIGLFLQQMAGRLKSICSFRSATHHFVSLSKVWLRKAKYINEFPKLPNLVRFMVFHGFKTTKIDDDHFDQKQ